MRRFLQNLVYRFSQFMYGRYGTDELNNVISIVGIALFVLSFIPYLWFLWFAPAVSGAIIMFRMFSKNLYKRRRELDRYYELKRKLTSEFSLRKKMFKERKTHRYFKCKTCKTVLRVPRKQNKIQVTCPKCRNITIK